MKRARDPFTQDEFDSMDDNSIIHIGEDCFHLPSLYAWVINYKANRNPLTNLEFSEQELEQIRSEAKNRFPLTLIILIITGKKQVIHTTNLASPLSLIPLITPDADTLFEFMTNRSQQGESFHLQVPLMKRSMSYVELVDAYGDSPLRDLGFEKDLMLFRSVHGTPPQSLSRNQMYLDIAARHQWPTELFTSQITYARRVIDENDAFKRRAELIRKMKPKPEPQPSGTRRFHVQVNTTNGAAYGSFLVYPNPDGQFSDLEPLVRERFREIDDIPRVPMRYLFASHAYSEKVKFSDVANLVDDCLIYIVF